MRRNDYPESNVVVWDPRGDFWQGAIVDADVALALEARGVATLPIEHDLLKSCSVSGFFFRAWGSGWPIDGAVPRMCCPMALYVARLETSSAISPTRLNWVARLVPDSDDVLGADGKLTTQGAIRLASDSGQAGMFGGGVSATERTAVYFASLPSADRDGGWTIRGDAYLNVAIDAMLGLGLYCSGRGVRVAWAAVSQSR